MARESDMVEQGEPGGRFDVLAIASSLPDSADSMMADHYMTDRPSGRTRVFRAYRPVAAHFHRECDEHLYVLSGRGTFWMGDPRAEDAERRANSACLRAEWPNVSAS